eukprot:SAG31_NODE_1040_length_10203_cov_3.045428_9_plen_366_part_00
MSPCLCALLCIVLRPWGCSAATVHWSEVDWAKCDDQPSAEASGTKWEFHSAGANAMRVKDVATSRCLAIQDCAMPVPGASAPYGKIVVEPCSTSNSCQGANQLWRFRCQHDNPMLITNVPPDHACAIESGTHDFGGSGDAASLQLHLDRLNATSVSNGQNNWCMCDVFSPDQVGNTLVNVAPYCGAANSQFVSSASDGTIRLRDPQHSGLGQCLHAKPCTSASKPPCSIPLSDGWIFSILFVVAVAIYLVGGIGYGVKTQTKQLGLQAHPHYEQMHAVGGLVVDGVMFTHARLNGVRAHNSSNDMARKKKSHRPRKHGDGSTPLSSEALPTPSIARSDEQRDDSHRSDVTSTTSGGGGRWVHVAD